MSNNAKTQRIRGLSFKQEYRSKVPITRGKRAPSMLQEQETVLVAPQAPEDKGKITIVLDLDETLIYARKGPLYVRPGVDKLMQLLKNNCETIVWTAGIKAYAQAVVRNIDTCDAIKHTVYRHSKWFSGMAGYRKDLTLLGRDLDTTLIIENTADCVRGNEENAILVCDYEGGEYEDTTIPAIISLLTELIHRRKTENITVPQFIRSSKQLVEEYIYSDVGDQMKCYCLQLTSIEEFKELKAGRVNLDLMK